MEYKLNNNLSECKFHSDYNSFAMGKIYLDHNIFVDIRKENANKYTYSYTEVKKFIDTLKHQGYTFVYSPAHIEDLAPSVQYDGYSEKKLYEEDFKIISELTDNNELLSVYNQHVKIVETVCSLHDTNFFLCIEYPWICYQRVVKNYNLINPKLEEINRNALERAREHWGDNKNKNNLDSLMHDSSFNELFIYNLFRFIYNLSLITTNHDMRKKYEDTANSLLHKQFFNIVKEGNIRSLSFVIGTIFEVFYNTLECFKITNEPIKKARSRMFDIHHVIHGAYCEYFITDDQKLFNTSVFAYKYLNIPTKVIKLGQLRDLIK